MAVKRKDAFLRGFDGDGNGSGNRPGSSVIGGKNQLEKLAEKGSRDSKVSKSAAAMGNDMLNKHRENRTDEVYRYGKGGAKEYARNITKEQNAMGMTGSDSANMYRSLGTIGPDYANNKYSRTSRQAVAASRKIDDVDRDNEEARFTQPGRPFRNYLESRKQRQAAKDAKADVKETVRKKK